MTERTWEYSFTLKIEGDVEERIDNLFEAGCDDATFGEVNGIAYADFAREAATFEEAVVSAVRNVESVGKLRVKNLPTRNGDGRSRESGV